ncbi:MAG: magnesium transporter [Candidatus Latescibacterota bacterium]|jgi:magnesium transporter
MTDPTTNPWEALKTVLVEEDPLALEHYLETLPTAEIARAISRLSQDEQTRLMTLLAPQDAAEIIEEVTEVQAVDLIEDLEPGQAATIIEEMRSDQQADLLGDLNDDVAEAILDEMGSTEAEEVRQLLSYPGDTAGGLMVTEYLTYAENQDVQDVVDDLLQYGSQYADYDVQYLFIIAESGALVGVLPLRDLLLTARSTRVKSVMRTDPHHLSPEASLDEVQQFFDDHSFFGVPITDESGKIVGIVQRAAVEKATGDQANKTYLESSGIVGGEELRSMKLWTRASRRLSWLSINILLNIAAASVIAFYQDTLAAVIALAVFLPIISDMSGCSGNQAVAVSIRELTLGLVKPREIFRVVVKEAGVGIFNGVILGCLIGCVAWIWQGNVYLGLVVGGALAANTLLAVLIGGLVPLVLRGFKMDPALASGPILTTVTDMFGFFLVLSLASALLPRLM